MAEFRKTGIFFTDIIGYEYITDDCINSAIEPNFQDSP